jgi:hypothetical protein
MYINDPEVFGGTVKRFRTLEIGEFRVTEGAGSTLDPRPSAPTRATLAVGTVRTYDTTQVLSVFDNRYQRLAVFRGVTAEGYIFYTLAEVGTVTGEVVPRVAIELLDVSEDPAPIDIFSDLLAAYREAKAISRV